MTLIICLPGNNFSGAFLDSFINFHGWCIRNGVNVIVSRHYECNIYYVRNMCLGGNSISGENQKPWQGKIKYDYILWVDSDIIFQITDFIKLFHAKKEIISGLYLMQDGKQFATVKEWNEDFFERNGRFEFLKPDLLIDQKKPIEVDYTGFGFMLIKYGVFEKLKYPWFRPLWKKFGNVTEFTMEDVAFCHLVKELGMNVWIHPEVVVKHEKKILL